MKYFVILIFFLSTRLICGNDEVLLSASDVNDGKYVIQKRFGFLKNIFGLGTTVPGPTVIIDRRFRGPKRRRFLRKCSPRRRRPYRRPVYAPVIGRRNFDVAFNYVPHRPRYLQTIPAFKQPPEDTYYYTFPNGLLDGKNIELFEPAPGDLLYPPMTPKISPRLKFNLYPSSKARGPELYPFYEHEAINLLPTSTMSNDVNHLYRRDDGAYIKPVSENIPNDLLPPKYNNNKNKIVTPSPVERNILTLSKLINDRKKKNIYRQQQPQQNSQENLSNNIKSSRGNIVIPLKRTSNPSSTTTLREPQSNYDHYPATNLFKNPLKSNNHDLLVDKNKNVDGGGGDHNTKTTRVDRDHNHYDTHNLQNKTMLMNVDDRNRLLYTIDDKIGVHDHHSMMDQVNDEGNYLKIYNIEPNYNWVNVDTKTALRNTTLPPNTYSSSIPAPENPLKVNSIIAERTKIY